MNLTRADDLRFGTDAEKVVVEHLNRGFGKTFTHLGQHSIFDFADEPKTIFVELKTRRVSSRQYPTTLVGLNKVNYAKENPDRTYYFVFNFTDGIFYIQYNPEVFAKYEVDYSFYRSRRADCGNPKQQLVHIWTEDLLLLPTGTNIACLG